MDNVSPTLRIDDTIRADCNGCVAAEHVRSFNELEAYTRTRRSAVSWMVGMCPANVPRNRFTNCIGADTAQVRLTACCSCTQCASFVQRCAAADREMEQRDTKRRAELTDEMARLTVADTLVASPAASFNISLQIAQSLLPCTYINAHFVRLVGGRRIICTQAPMCEAVNGVDTRADFWRMVHESRATAVVCLAKAASPDTIDTTLPPPARDVMNDAQNRAFVQYWPSECGKEAAYGNVTVRLEQIAECAVHVRGDGDPLQYKVLRLSVYTANLPLSTLCVHLVLYDTWPDMGTPHSIEAFVAFLKHVNSLWADAARPLVMHCTAGMGRTGVAAAATHMLQHIEQGGLPNVRDTVQTNRECGRHLVQTAEQYAFLEECLLQLNAEHAAAHRQDTFLKHGHCLWLPSADKK
jgi:protein tyrosine phosphatase